MLFTDYRNRRARTFAQQRGYPEIGASDAPLIPYVGRAYTEVTLPGLDPTTPPAVVDGGTVVDALRRGESQLRGKRTPIHRGARRY
jgi:hypothetical protein